jgi:hypothetical protein
VFTCGVNATTPAEPFPPVRQDQRAIGSATMPTPENLHDLFGATAQCIQDLGWSATRSTNDEDVTVDDHRQPGSNSCQEEFFGGHFLSNSRIDRNQAFASSALLASIDSVDFSLNARMVSGWSIGWSWMVGGSPNPRVWTPTPIR